MTVSFILFNAVVLAALGYFWSRWRLAKREEFIRTEPLPAMRAAMTKSRRHNARAPPRVSRAKTGML